METQGQHLVDRSIAVAGAALTEVAEASLLGLDQQATAHALQALVRLEAQVAELTARVLVHADQVKVAEPSGATTTATWLAHRTRLTRRAARQACHTAAALDRYDLLRAGLAAGKVNAEQAPVIARALDALPADLPPGLLIEAEQALVDLAARHDAKDLRLLGDRILLAIAPEVGEAHEADKLATEEREAEQAARLTMTPDGHGKVHGRFTLPELHAGMLRKLLMTLVLHHKPQPEQQPEHQPEPSDPSDPSDPSGGEEKAPQPGRRASAEETGRAFCELLERLDGSWTPTMGGTGATVVVTMTLETLHGSLATAVLDTGDRIPAHTARRLACEAGIIPLVLDGTGRPLDVGRTKRYFTPTQVLALMARDRGCTAAGCDAAPWYCHAHHDRPWSVGGPTDLANGRLLCPSHHIRIHDPTYQHQLTADNQVTFTKIVQRN